MNPLNFEVYSAVDVKKTKLNKDGTLTIEGVASTTNPDDQQEIVSRKAMNGLCKQAIARNLHLDHEWTFKGAIGAIKKAYTKGNKMHIKANILPKPAKDIKERLDLGMHLGLSIAGKPIYSFKSQAKYPVIDEFDLTEISLVVMPSNMDTLGSVVSKSSKTIEGTCFSGVCKSILEKDESIKLKSKKNKKDNKKEKKEDSNQNKDKSNQKSSEKGNSSEKTNDESPEKDESNQDESKDKDSTNSGSESTSVKKDESSSVQRQDGEEKFSQERDNKLADNQDNGNPLVNPDEEKEQSELNEDLVVKVFNELMAEEKGLIVQDILNTLRTELQNMGVNVSPANENSQEDEFEDEDLDDDEFEDEDFDEDEFDEEDLDEEDLEDEDLEDEDLEEDLDEEDLEDEDPDDLKKKKKKKKLKKKLKKKKLVKKSASKKGIVEAVLREIDSKKSSLNSKYNRMNKLTQNQVVEKKPDFDPFGRLIKDNGDLDDKI